MARQRDYRREYQQRLERGSAAGLSRQQARRSGPSASGGFSRLLQNAVADLRNGRYKSVSETARKSHIDAERLSLYMQSTGQATRERGRLVHQPDRITSEIAGGVVHIRQVSYHVPVISGGELYEIDVNQKTATRIGEYMSAVGQFIRRGKIDALEQFEDEAVVDINGQNYPLETDPSMLTELYAYEDISWDEIYKRNG